MITNTKNKITYKGNSLATEFAYTFPITAPEDLKVILVGFDGSQTVLKKDYFVDTIKKVVIYPGYPPGQELDESSRPPILADGQKLILYRELDALQLEDFGQVYPLNILERALDKLTILVQQVLEKISRTVTIPLGSDFKGDLPAPVRENSAICISADGTGLRYGADPDVAMSNSKDAVARITDLERRYNNAKISDADSLNGKTYDEIIAEASSITDAQTLQGSSKEEVRANIDAVTLNGVTKDEIIAAASQPIGTIYHAIRTDTPEGSVRLDGGKYTQALLPDVYQMMLDGKLPSCTYDEYAEFLSQNNGNCGIFGLDEENKTFKVPSITDGILISSALNGTIGEYFKAGLPNITGTLTASAFYGNSSASQASECFSIISNGNSRMFDTGGGSGSTLPTYKLDASLSSPIYGKSDTVQPKHIRYPLFMVLFNKQQTASEAQYGEFIGALEGKANKDFNNITPLAKTTIQHALMPDYTAKVALPSGTINNTVQNDGLLIFDGSFTNSGHRFYINDTYLGFFCSSATNVKMVAPFLVKKGDTYRTDSSVISVYYCPFRV